MPPQSLETRLQAICRLADEQGLMVIYRLDPLKQVARFVDSQGLEATVPLDEILILNSGAVLMKISQAIGMTPISTSVSNPWRPMELRWAGIDFDLRYLQEAGYSRCEASHLRLLRREVESGRVDRHGSGRTASSWETRLEVLEVG